jgi:heptosyltransferase-3
VSREGRENRAAITAWQGLNASLRLMARGMFLRDPRRFEPARVVVHLIGNIGDIIVAVPALMALRARFPEAMLTLLTSPGKRGMPGAAQLLTGVSYLDRMHVYHAEDIASPTHQVALAKTVRGWKPDLMVFLPSSRVPAKTVYRNLAFARLCGPKAIFNYQVPASPWYRLSQAITQDRFPHEIERHLTALRPLGIHDAVSFELGAASASDVARIDALAATAAGRPVLAVCAGGKQEGHLWPVDRFAAVCERAHAELDAAIWIVGGPGDKTAAQAIVEVVPTAVDLTGELSLLGSYALLNQADVMLTNDTGPMHLAVAAGTRVCAIFSSQNYVGRWYPYGEGHMVFRAEKACPVCLFNERRTLHCVGRIGVDEVARACLDTLAAATDTLAPTLQP